MADEVSTHALIMAGRVIGAAVFNKDGERIGHVEDLSIDKASGRVLYAILSFGGFLGVGEHLHPMPWPILEFDTALNGYVAPLDRAALEKAPSLDRARLEELGAGDAWRTQLFAYYGPYGAPPYI